MCCADGYCDSNETCCEDTGCIPQDAHCCSDGGYCPDPFECVKIRDTGNIGCCTDLTCSVYLSAGQTVTYAPTTTYASYTDTYEATTATSYLTTDDTTATYYNWYYTTIYW